MGASAQAGSVRSRSHQAHPSIAGSEIAVRIRSGLILEATTNAPVASPARLTWWPRCPSARATIR